MRGSPTKASCCCRCRARPSPPHGRAGDPFHWPPDFGAARLACICPTSCLIHLNEVQKAKCNPPGEPLLSGFPMWRIAFVSTLFLAGIFGMFECALHLGSSVETARTVAVSTLVCMEVFYLASVRYRKAPSFTWQGVRGTPRVLVAVTGVVLLQMLFTYASADAAVVSHRSPGAGLGLRDLGLTANCTTSSSGLDPDGLRGSRMTGT